MADLPLGPDGEFFWSPGQVRRLGQLVDLGAVLPSWVTSRWVLSQAVRFLDRSRHGSAMRALGVAVGLRGGLHALPGVDEHDARALVVDSDWIYRQVLLHEEGGLAHFRRRVATRDLLADACHLDEWEAAPMGAYRLLSRAPSAVTWEQVGREQTLTVPNLGCAALVVPGDHVIGRTVPTEEGVMFDLAPVQVPEQVARQVALEPARWVDALGAAADGPDPVVVTPFYDVLPNDVPVVLWQYCLLVSASRSLPTPAALPAALASATVRLAREVLVDPSGVAADDALDPWPWLAAASSSRWSSGPSSVARSRRIRQCCSICRPCSPSRPPRCAGSSRTTAGVPRESGTSALRVRPPVPSQPAG